MRWLASELLPKVCGHYCLIFILTNLLAALWWMCPFTSPAFENSYINLWLFSGAIDGLINLCFVYLICAWYTARELPFRRLFWVTGSHILFNKFNHRSGLAYVGVTMGQLCVGFYAYYFLGTPQEVRWLPTQERLARAILAMRRSHAMPWSAEVRWRRPTVLLPMFHVFDSSLTVLS